MTITLWYFVDGHSIPRFYKSKKEAKNGEQLAFEDANEGYNGIQEFTLKIDENDNIINSNSDLNYNCLIG